MQLRGLERWISIVRLIALPFAIGAAKAAASVPAGQWKTWAWVTTCAFALGAAGLFILAARLRTSPPATR